jgi:hypothetical protein
MARNQKALPPPDPDEWTIPPRPPEAAPITEDERSMLFGLTADVERAAAVLDHLKSETKVAKEIHDEANLRLHAYAKKISAPLPVMPLFDGGDGNPRPADPDDDLDSAA